MFLNGYATLLHHYELCHIVTFLNGYVHYYIWGQNLMFEPMFDEKPNFYSMVFLLCTCKFFLSIMRILFN